MNNLEKIEDNAYRIVKILQDAGFIAVYAGGYVRDKLLRKIGEFPTEINKEDIDIDIATSATTEDLAKIFDYVKPVGKSFGVNMLDLNGNQYEVATLRKERGSLDGRHPEHVEFTNSLEEDSNRRDFTCNAVYYDPVNEKYHDFHNGIHDINNKKLRFVNYPHKRIIEDYLRMLRAVRFAAQYNFEIDASSLASIIFYAGYIKQISPDRIRMEIDKMLDNNINVLDALYNTGLLIHIFPELEKTRDVRQRADYHPEGTVWNHIYSGFDHFHNKIHDTNISLDTKWAWLLHDIGKPVTQTKTEKGYQFLEHEKVGAVMARNMLERLNMSKERTERIVSLIENHMRIQRVPEMRTSKALRFVHSKYFPEQLGLLYIDSMASDGNLDAYHAIITIQGNSIYKAAISLPKPTITGKDIMSWGYPEGKIIGLIKKYFQYRELEGHSVDNAQEEAYDVFQPIIIRHDSLCVYINKSVLSYIDIDISCLEKEDTTYVLLFLKNIEGQSASDIKRIREWHKASLFNKRYGVKHDELKPKYPVTQNQAKAIIKGFGKLETRISSTQHNISQLPKEKE